MVALAFLLAAVLPAVNSAISYNDTVVAGETLELAGGITFVPEPGWGITSGVRRGAGPKVGQYPASATVVDGNVTFTVRSASFDGDANALLDQIKTTTDALRSARGIRIEGERSAVSTSSGEHGVMTGVRSAQAAGLIAVFVMGGQGVAAVVTGPNDPTGLPDDAVMRMITSLRAEEKPQ